MQKVSWMRIFAIKDYPHGWDVYLSGLYTIKLLRLELWLTENLTTLNKSFLNYFLDYTNW